MSRQRYGTAVCHQGVFVVELREKCNKTCCFDVLDAFDDFVPDWKILKIWENIHKCKYCLKPEGELNIFSPGCSSYWIRKIYRGQPWQPASFSPDSLFLIKIVLSSYCVTYFIYLLFKRKANVGLPVSSIEVGLRSDSLVKLGAFSFPDSWVPGPWLALAASKSPSLMKIVLSSYCVTYFIHLLFKREGDVGLPVTPVRVGLRSDSLVK